MGPLEPITEPDYEQTIYSENQPNNFWTGLASAGGIIGGIAGAIGNVRAAKKAYQTDFYNRGMQSVQNTLNYLHYMDALKYNTPKEQMKRFEEAGINPNLAAGLVSGNTSQPFATAPAYMAQPAPAGIVGKQVAMLANQARESYYDAMIKKEQYYSLREQRLLTRAKNYLTNIQTALGYDKHELVGDIDYIRGSIGQQYMRGLLGMYLNPITRDLVTGDIVTGNYVDSLYKRQLLDTDIRRFLREIYETRAEYADISENPIYQFIGSIIKSFIPNFSFSFSKSKKR